ncbi:hypothetical protein FRC09_012408, partial [Ceratobasidium sp. 395]
EIKEHDELENTPDADESPAPATIMIRLDRCRALRNAAMSVDGAIPGFRALVKK